VSLMTPVFAAMPESLVPTLMKGSEFPFFSTPRMLLAKTFAGQHPKNNTTKSIRGRC
jgi:hypothetical protein